MDEALASVYKRLPPERATRKRTPRSPALCLLQSQANSSWASPSPLARVAQRSAISTRAHVWHAQSRRRRRGKREMAQQQVVIVGEEHCDGEDRELTVRKTTLFTPGDGLEAYDHRTGALAFRVETYGRGGVCGGGAAAGDLALLGPEGEPVLTVRRRRPSLHNRWEGFLGDGAARGQKPIFSARRSSILGAGTGAAAVLVDLLAPAAAHGEFRVDGSFPRRCCRVVAGKVGVGDGGEEDEDVVVAEVRRKVDEGAHVLMGRDVFVLWVRAGFDAAFAMGIVLVLDRITGDEVDGDLGEDLLEAISPV